MARARNIKPGFFKNEDLCELDPIYRLLFIGLWTLADREGRIEDRPKRIKMELFPCDNIDVDDALECLRLAGFISRYEVCSVRVISIPNFLKHQSPHGTERDSELPDEQGFLTVHERGRGGCVTGSSHSIHVNERGNNVKQRESTKPKRPDSPNPDSPNPESVNQPTSTTNTLGESATISPSSSRSAEILTAIARLESGRGNTSKITTSSRLVAAWVSAGITDAQLAEAYAMAAAERDRVGDRGAINAGFLDAFVAKVINPPDRDMKSAVVSVVQRPKPVCICCGASETTKQIGADWYCGKHDQHDLRDMRVRKTA